MANTVTASSLYRFLSHKKKVCRLYKRSVRHLEAWCEPAGRHVFAYERTLLRARFDQHKGEENMVRATQLLRLAEEEFWLEQHPAPFLFINEPGGTAWERPIKNQLPEGTMSRWEAPYKAMFPDYFKNREKWCETRRDTWEGEMKWLQEWDKQNIEDGVSMTDQFPAAKEKDGYPPFWWKQVTRPLEQPLLMDWFPDDEDNKIGGA